MSKLLIFCFIVEQIIVAIFRRHVRKSTEFVRHKGHKKRVLYKQIQQETGITMDSSASSDKMRLSCESAAVTEVTEVISVLGVHPEKGLSSLDASRRRNYHGFNEVKGNDADPLWKKYLDQFNNPFILLLLASALIR